MKQIIYKRHIMLLSNGRYLRKFNWGNLQTKPKDANQLEMSFWNADGCVDIKCSL